jgi:hypothetical protein
MTTSKSDPTGFYSEDGVVTREQFDILLAPRSVSGTMSNIHVTRTGRTLLGWPVVPRKSRGWRRHIRRTKGNQP